MTMARHGRYIMEIHEMMPLKRAKAHTRQTSPEPQNSPLVTPKSEARSEISVKFGIYEGKVENFRVRCLPPLYICRGGK